MAVKKKKRPLGDPLPKTSANYVDPAPAEDEVNGLVALWDLFAPPEYTGMLRAENKTVLEQTGQKPKGRFIWDDQIKRYIRVETGRVITRKELHIAYSEFVRAYADR